MSLEIALQVGVNMKYSCTEKACTLEELWSTHSDCMPRRQAGHCFTRVTLSPCPFQPLSQGRKAPYSAGRGTESWL